MPAEKMYAKNNCAPPSGHSLQRFCTFGHWLHRKRASAGRSFRRATAPKQLQTVSAAVLHAGNNRKIQLHEL